LTIFFVVAALPMLSKQHGKNQNKNTGLFINCMDFVVVCGRPIGFVQLCINIQSSTALECRQYSRMAFTN
jgi:hypothetical protein